MATHASTLAWKVPWTEEPGGLPSMVSHRVGHDWSDLAAAATALCRAWCVDCVSWSRGQGAMQNPLSHFKVSSFNLFVLPCPRGWNSLSTTSNSHGEELITKYSHSAKHKGKNIFVPQMPAMTQKYWREIAAPLPPRTPVSVGKVGVISEGEWPSNL